MDKISGESYFYIHINYSYIICNYKSYIKCVICNYSYIYVKAFVCVCVLKAFKI